MSEASYKPKQRSYRKTKLKKKKKIYLYFFFGGILSRGFYPGTLLSIGTTKWFVVRARGLILFSLIYEHSKLMKKKTFQWSICCLCGIFTTIIYMCTCTCIKYLYACTQKSERLAPVGIMVAPLIALKQHNNIVPRLIPNFIYPKLTVNKELNHSVHYIMGIQKRCAPL